MIDQMSIACEKMMEELTDDGRKHTFRAFMFKTANTLFHEISHVFVTYLTKGQELTPPQINDPTVGISGDDGEAGRAMEYMMFEATINYFREPTSGKPASEKSTSGETSGTYPARGTPDEHVCFKYVLVKS